MQMSKSKIGSLNPFEMKQDPKIDFSNLSQILRNKKPFTFIRFSDGEMDIIKNRKVHIGKNIVQWNENIVFHDYPIFDYKDFDPAKNQEIRSALLVSAQHYGENFFKGLPAKHNNAVMDRDLMIEYNGSRLNNLTFADLLINQNFLQFRKVFLPLFLNFSNIHYVGNFRATPKMFSPQCSIIPVQDNFFKNYQVELSRLITDIERTPSHSLILLSASSLSNILGYKLHSSRPDLTVLDVGTSMHDLVGLGNGNREYHNLLFNWSLKKVYRKQRYKLSKHYKLVW
jgi:hypothetical protein